MTDNNPELLTAGAGNRLADLTGVGVVRHKHWRRNRQTV